MKIKISKISPELICYVRRRFRNSFDKIHGAEYKRKLEGRSRQGLLTFAPYGQALSAFLEVDVYASDRALFRRRRFVDRAAVSRLGVSSVAKVTLA